MTTVRVKFNSVSRPLHFFIYGFILFGSIGLIEGALIHHKIFQFYAYTLWPARMKRFDEYQEGKQAYIESKLTSFEYDKKPETIDDAKRMIFNAINKPKQQKANEQAAINAISHQETVKNAEDQKLQVTLQGIEQQMTDQVIADRLKKTEEFQAMRKLANEEQFKTD